MLKKIKDLTKKEIDKICKKHFCLMCPLYIDYSRICITQYFEAKEKIKNKLKEKIEVEE